MLALLKQNEKEDTHQGCALNNFTNNKLTELQMILYPDPGNSIF